MQKKGSDKKPVGQAIAQLRKKKGESLEDLSRETGLSVSHLEKIEEGTDFAPVGDILKIARALTVDPGKLLDAGKGGDRASEKELEKKRIQDFDRREQAYQYEVLTPEAKKSHLRAFRVSIPPRSEHPKVNYQHEGEELVYVLKGEVEIEVGQKKHHLHKDETLHFNSGIRHTLKNPGNTASLLLVALYTP